MDSDRAPARITTVRLRACLPNTGSPAFAEQRTLWLGPTIRSVLPSLRVRAGTPAVLLHHSPVGLSYAQNEGIALMLAGHTHGGQIFPFNWLTPLLFPFNEGLYERAGTQIYVSPGAGTFMIPARLGTSNQVDFLSLRPQ